MADVKYTNAIKVFNQIDAYLKSKDWKYDKDTDKLHFNYSVNTDDFPMSFTLIVDANKEMIRSLSFMPFKFAEDKRVEGAVAVCVANYGMVNGSFDYDISEGKISFRLTNSFTDTMLSTELIWDMIGVSFSTIDRYNDRFFMVAKNVMTIEQFIKAEG
jgi:hypothetical protein